MGSRFPCFESEPNYLSRGSRASRRPSPKRLKPSTVTKMARPGNSDSQRLSWMKATLALRSQPQLGVGGWVPSPRKLGRLHNDGGRDAERGGHDDRRQAAGQDVAHEDPTFIATHNRLSFGPECGRPTLQDIPLVNNEAVGRSWGYCVALAVGAASVTFRGRPSSGRRAARGGP